jgi:hypothetical protein
MSTTDLLALAEEPGLWSPPAPHTRIVRPPGFTVIARHEQATVEAIRLEPGAVAWAVEEARRIARSLGMDGLVWWVGDLSRPADLVESLRAVGLVPFAEEPGLTTLTITRAPEGPTGVDVRRVDDVAAYREAVEVDWEAWGVPRAARAARRAALAAEWEAGVASGRLEYHVALVDGRPAAFSRLVATPAAGLLMGGAVAPWARGRGAYRALVAARWHAAVARGTPRLVTAAGAMSAPVLERLGFTRIGAVQLLSDPFL